MSISYGTTGRASQKARTHDAIIAAARLLVSDGPMPTIEQAAGAAGVSRATAYRYFPTQRSLVTALYAWIDAPSLLSDDVGDDVEERLAVAADRFLAMVSDNAGTLREMFRLSLERDGHDREDLVLRRGRRIRWIGDALDPMRSRLSPSAFKRLVHAIGASIGIESFVWLTEVAGMSKDDAIRTMRWSASALLRAATQDVERQRRRRR